MALRPQRDSGTKGTLGGPSNVHLRGRRGGYGDPLPPQGWSGGGSKATPKHPMTPPPPKWHVAWHAITCGGGRSSFTHLPACARGFIVPT
mmetsp:Transcript_80258/g.141564  ORF Transcript_80258/g.141564 Transcript_80258/m.141564 type:complete len:90 (+) Transcript_80258:273-542(+)